MRIRFPVKGDLSRLRDNKGQAISSVAALEEKLASDGTRETYNTKIAAFVERGDFKSLDKEEIDKWTGPVNLISNHGVPQPSSVSTAL